MKILKFLENSGAGGRAAPKHREPTHQGGHKPQTELVSGTVELEIARSHVPVFRLGSLNPS
jgi:hypothetical protein